MWEHTGMQRARKIRFIEPPDDLDAIPTLNHHLIRDFDRLLSQCRRRVRAPMEQRLPVRDKLAQLWANARTARTTRRDWRNENKGLS